VVPLVVARPSGASSRTSSVKIVDTEGRIVPVGTAGELMTRGYSVMLGYWNDAERTAEAIDAAGWMHTGDLATLDAEGFCNIVGRIKAWLGSPKVDFLRGSSGARRMSP
jgi:long-subunit acyl-CoA synthetase (AMP-forming)